MRRHSKGQASEMISIGDTNSNNGQDLDYDVCDPDMLKDVLKPLVFSMRVFGTVYGDVFQAPKPVKINSIRPFSKSSNYDMERQQDLSTTKCKWERWRHFGLCYSIISSVIIFTVLAHQTYDLVVSRTMMDTMTRGFLVFWVILCGLQHAICVVITSHRTRKNPLNRFDKLVKAIMLVRSTSISKNKSAVRKILAVAWTCMIVNTILPFAGAYYPNRDVSTSIRAVFAGKSNWTLANNDMIVYAYNVAVPFLCANWTIPTCFYVSLCFVVSGCFDDLYERTSSAIWKKKKINFEDLRAEYVHLCNLLSSLNDLLSPLGMLMFTIYIPNICLNINVCIQTFNQDSVINRVAYIFWITANVSILLVVSVSGAQVNNSAIRLSEVIYNINAQELDKKGKLELMLLLSNLNANIDGLTVGGLVTVTKEMIITIFGTIVGYLTILIQFK